MNVVFSSSNLYSTCTGIAIYSLLVTNKALSNLNIYVLITDMTDDNKSKIANMVSNFNRKLFFIQAEELFEKVKNKYNFNKFKGSMNTYFRILANEILPKNVERALFVDSDILFNGSICELENIDMSNVVSLGVPEIMLRTNHVCHEDVNLLNQCPFYINYGVVLFNLNNWRKFNCDYLISKCVLENPNGFKIAEQSLLNYALKDYTNFLNLKYNFYTMLHGISYKTMRKWYPKCNFFLQDEFYEASSSPVIVHFVGDYFCRPWYKNNICRFSNLYIKYYIKSPWQNEVLLSKPKDINLFFKLYYAILKFMRMHYFDNEYFLFRYILVQWLKDKFSFIKR